MITLTPLAIASIVVAGVELGVVWWMWGRVAERIQTQPGSK